ncbi:MAG: hypothetical protein R2681_17235 [Pyrinomonadaceae bacterium]
MTNFSENEVNDITEQFGAADVFPVVTRFPADLITPFGAYLKLSKDSEYSFLFESVEGGENLARYSFLGANPEKIIVERDNETQIRRGKNIEIKSAPIYEYLRNELRKRKIAEVPNLPSFIGAVGYFDFSAVGHF